MAADTWVWKEWFPDNPRFGVTISIKFLMNWHFDIANRGRKRGVNLKTLSLLFLNASAPFLCHLQVYFKNLESGEKAKHFFLLNNSTLFPLLPPQQMWLQLFVVSERVGSLTSDCGVLTTSLEGTSVHLADLGAYTPCASPWAESDLVLGLLEP